MVNIIFKKLVSTVKSLGLMLLTGLLVLHMATAAFASDSSDVPDLVPGQQQWVIDLAGVLSTSTEAAVKDKLAELAAETGKQVRLLTVQRIDLGQPAEEFTTEVFDRWFPDAADKANQVLVFMATEDHRTALKAGDGVQKVLADDIAKSIAYETILFPAQKSNYNQAAIDGVNRLTAILSGLPDPGAPVIPETPDSLRNYATAEETDQASSSVIVIVLLVLATLIPMVTYFWLQKSP